MPIWIQTLLLFLLFTLNSRDVCAAHYSHTTNDMALQAACPAATPGENTNYRLQEDILQPTHKPEALITDTTSAARLCNSRPQRILPTFGSNATHRSTGSSFHNKFYSLHFCGTDRYLKTVTTPIPSSVSCHYYVIALRRIIR